MLLLAVFVAAAIAATPVHPNWPRDFSATVEVRVPGQRRPDFSRWFYSTAANVDRLDGLAEFAGELYFAERFFNHNAQREYAVFYQRDTVQCIKRAIRNPLPKPDFKNFTYVGEALIDYVPVYHWILRSGRDFFQFFDAVGSRLPMRFDVEFANRPGVQILYREFDKGSQNSAIFQIPTAILNVCQEVATGVYKPLF